MDLPERKILHIDMDAFFASVEQLDNPSLRGRPVAVGHAERRGVVAAASYEARRFGVHSAMPGSQARRLCPQLIFVDCRFDRYREVSHQIHDIFHEYTDVVEPLSLDEAFLDVTYNKPGIELGVDIAREIKHKIRERLGLVASAGVSYNKFLAKVASDYRKPDGLCTIHPSRAHEFIYRLPVESFWGVGPVTAARMHSLGIHTGADLHKCTPELLTHEFGKAGMLYYNFARGIDHRRVEPVRERKSLGCEHTYDTDVSAPDEVDRRLVRTVDDLVERATRKGWHGATLTLKVKFHDFSQITRSLTPSDPPVTHNDILHLARLLMNSVDYSSRPIRLIGLTLSNPIGASDSKPDEGRQLIIPFPADAFRPLPLQNKVDGASTH